MDTAGAEKHDYVTIKDKYGKDVRLIGTSSNYAYFNFPSKVDSKTNTSREQRIERKIKKLVLTGT